ncbi:peptidylprolyl isomerase [Acetivibrio clariflavus]|uniref:Peptidyl-prolyl cis-trans isomerase n=1 Tax=Acetivibrio clariflavus (strain DSM 19732 / NBRC 101661 / EBR45) TaxID=720554 RepID=G8LXQ1_ACECE|nr:peptidylprolyl isomerase [Acetivibrio clariflavus]AEV67762.1 peptidyl-prolyl cis-trans isomerase (rotamase) - cyclophilin family [Acetivibrio clariflavus DSM 19732]
MLKKVLILLMCLVIPLSFAGCKNNKGSGSSSDAEIDQFAPPAKGETIAIMKTSMGDIKIKFFPSVAPKAVENFITHAKNGYYDNVIFHRVINDFMIQGGDPTGTGMGGESIWNEPFEDEFSEKLRNYRGALSMANRGPNTNGSQFFIVQAPSDTITQDWIDQMKSNKFPDDVVAKYKEVGGTPWLDNKHTVFGQVYEGMDIVDKIAAVEVGANDKPVKDVRILGIEITTVP